MWAWGDKKDEEVDQHMRNNTKVVAFVIWIHNMSITLGFINELNIGYYNSSVTQNIISIAYRNKFRFRFSFLFKNNSLFYKNDMIYGIYKIGNDLCFLTWYFYISCGNQTTEDKWSKKIL